MIQRGPCAITYAASITAEEAAMARSTHPPPRGLARVRARAWSIVRRRPTRIRAPTPWVRPSWSSRRRPCAW